MFTGSRAAEDRRALLAAFEQEIHDGQVGHEVAMQLRINVVDVILPLDLDARPGKKLRVEVVPGRAAREVTMSAHVLAEGKQALALPASDAELGRAERLSLEPEPPTDELGHRQIEVHEQYPASLEHLLERGQVAVKVRRRAVELLERPHVFAGPWRPVVDLHLVDGRPVPAGMEHGHGQPMGPASGRLDAVAVAPTVLVELDVVIVDEHARALQLVEESQPRKVSGLEHDQGAGRHHYIPLSCLAPRPRSSTAALFFAHEDTPRRDASCANVTSRLPTTERSRRGITRHGGQPT